MRKVDIVIVLLVLIVLTLVFREVLIEFVRWIMRISFLR